jgi:peptide/nickel transport system permease protein
VVTVIGLQIPILVGGSVVFESIFSLPGVGQFLLNALQNRDYTVVQGIDLVFAIMVIGTNLLVDSLYPVLDARVRLS